MSCGLEALRSALGKEKKPQREGGGEQRLDVSVVGSVHLDLCANVVCRNLLVICGGASWCGPDDTTTTVGEGF